MTERERGHRRVQANAHELVVYRAAIDSVYRRRILADAGFDD